MIGERLAEIRKDHGDRQADLATKLNVAISSVRKWEQDLYSPSHEILVSICKLYNVSSDFLLGLTNDDPLYSKHRRESKLSNKDMESLHEYEEFLLWKQKKPPK